MTATDKLDMVWALLGYIDACDKKGPTEAQWAGIQKRAKKELERRALMMTEMMVVGSDLDVTKIDLERIA